MSKEELLHILKYDRKLFVKLEKLIETILTDLLATDSNEQAEKRAILPNLIFEKRQILYEIQRIEKTLLETQEKEPTKSE